MASLYTDGDNRIIQYKSGKQRPKIHLGKMSLRDAKAVKEKVEKLISAKRANLGIDTEVTKWLEGVAIELRDRLAELGLIVAPERPEEKTAPRLGAFLDAYKQARQGDKKSGTITNYGQTARFLLGFFDAEKRLDSITAGHAEEFELHLKTETDLAKNTVRRHLGRAKQFFRFATRKGLIPANPFEDVKDCRVQANKKREHFVTLEETQALLGSCPDAEWRAIVALCRFGALRCPSEVLKLTWQDVNFDAGRITVDSPKTEHVDKENRVIPLFPELREHLQAAWDAAPEGATHVISRYRSTETNLRTQYLRICKRAGIKPWPSPFQNMRRTRATELASEFPRHVYESWLGHAGRVADEHYLRTTVADFDKAVQNRVQTVAVHTRPSTTNEQKGDHRNDSQPLSCRSKTGLVAFSDMQANTCILTPTGFEPVSRP